MKKYLYVAFILVSHACTNKLEFEISTAKSYGYYDWKTNYRAFYLLSNYDESKYNNVQKFISSEFKRIITANDSLNFVQFDFYKKNWNTSIFIDTWDPYGHHSLMLPENDHKYGKYCIEGIFYKRIEKSDKWIYVAMKKNITDTIEVKINK